MDLLRLEVLNNAFLTVTEEMSATLHRSAFSTNIKTRKDYSCALFDREGRLVAQAFAQPAHLGVLAMTVPTATKRYGVDRLRPGDCLCVNDPYCGSGHLNDVCLIAPVFKDDELLAFVASTAHHVDIGGGAPGGLTLSRELYQEGFIIPPIRIVNEGRINTDLLDLFVRNIRAKQEGPGDLKAQMAANSTGIARFMELLDKYEPKTLFAYIEELIQYAKRRTLAACAELPHQEYSAEDYMDDDGFTDEPLVIRVKVTLDESGMTCDFTGTASQRPSPVNAPVGWTYSAVSYVFKCLIGQDIPLNYGFYHCVNLKAPLGTIVNPSEPAGVACGAEIAQRVIGTLFRAFSKAVPERVTAASKGSVNQIGFGAHDPRHVKYCTYYEAIGGGSGGRQGLDGVDGIQTDFSNTENAPVEEVEISYPMRIVRCGLIPDSGGPGQWRGGMGIRRDIQFPYGPATFSIMCDRVKFAPWGIEGGLMARSARHILNPDSPSERALKSKGTFEVQQNDIVSIQTPGGGGYGDPRARDIERVRRDVVNGKVSVEQARSAYGVAVTSEGVVDTDRTQKLRRGIHEEEKRDYAEV